MAAIIMSIAWIVNQLKPQQREGRHRELVGADSGGAVAGAVSEAARGAYLASNQIKTKAHLTKKSYR